MKRIEDGYELSSGRQFHANRGLVSIVEHKDEDRIHGRWELGEGYDGGIDVRGYDWTDPPTPSWTSEERADLADYMIAVWQAFKDGAK